MKLLVTQVEFDFDVEDYMTILHKKDIDTGDIEDLCCEVSEAIQHKLEDIQEKESYFNKHEHAGSLTFDGV